MLSASPETWNLNRIVPIPQSWGGGTKQQKKKNKPAPNTKEEKKDICDQREQH